MAASVISADVLADTLARLTADPDLHSVHLGRVELGSEVLHQLPSVVDDLTDDDAQIVLLTDGVDYAYRNDTLSVAVAELLSPRRIRAVVAPTNEGRTHADPGTLDAVTRAAGAADLILTVGSGTLADIGKVVAARLGPVPHVIVQTALSVNGFADDKSVLLLNGVKRTTQSRWPDALLMDTEVLTGAPVALNMAGVGDLAAMFTAPADWRLASELGLGEPYRPQIVEMVRPYGDRLLELAPRLAGGEPLAVEQVAWLLTLSGISMGAAGTTAPSSGAEHTISHLIDMAQLRHGRITALHGAQVGVSTVLVSLVWERVLAVLAIGRPQPQFPTEAHMAPLVRQAFDGLDPSGSMTDECWTSYRVKLARWNALAETSIDWAAVTASVSGMLVPAAQLAGALRSAGADVQFSTLTPPIDKSTARWAVANAHLMRDRFTVLDLAFFLGCWFDDDIDALLSSAAELGAGL